MGNEVNGHHQQYINDSNELQGPAICVPKVVYVIHQEYGEGYVLNQVKDYNFDRFNRLGFRLTKLFESFISIASATLATNYPAAPIPDHMIEFVLRLECSGKAAKPTTQP